MDFRLDDGQIELQQTVERFCADRFPFDAIADRAGPLDRARWRELAELGMFGLLLGEERGGSGLGAVEAAIVFEQLGSHLVPGPILWTVLAAPYIEGAANGTTIVGGIEASAVEQGSALVEHADDLDVLLVVDHGWVARRMAGLDRPYRTDPLDPLTPVGRVGGLGPAAPGDESGDATSAADLRTLGTVLAASLLSGLASRALEVARAYALEREQFGVPIGSFQAIKHLLADMYVRSGLAQSATYAAAAVLDDAGSTAAARSAATAKLLAADAAVTNAGTAIQVLGGMGFTWDMLPNYLLKRAWVLAQSFGTADDHALFLGSTFAGAPA